MKKTSLVSLFFLVFFISGLLGYKQIYPFPQIYQSLKSSQQYLSKTIYQTPIGLKPVFYQEQGLTRNRPALLQPGMTALQGWFKEGVKIKLLDLQGKLIHEWPIDYFATWKDLDHLPEHTRPQSAFDFHAQGMHLYPDASALFNVSQVGLVKVDKCGHLQWKLNRFNHHSLTVDARGDIWVPANKPLDAINKELLFRHYKNKLFESREAMVYDNLVLQVNQDGKVLREISVLEKLLAYGLEDQLFDSLYIDPVNPVHLNDIEVVNAALASHLPNVEEGDLLISLRNMHTLAILSRDSGDIVWHKTGPWVRQHDPDISESGTITVYNNRSRLLQRAEQEPYSNILEFHPASHQLSVLYPLSEDSVAFFSSFMGTHQMLDNGNILIAESTRGRVFEVNQEGEVVWEYIEHYNEHYAAMIAEARRYPDDYFSLTSWSCD